MTTDELAKAIVTAPEVKALGPSDPNMIAMAKFWLLRAEIIDWIETCSDMGMMDADDREKMLAKIHGVNV